MLIREATEADFDLIWPVFKDIVRRGDTYAIPMDICEAEGPIELWMKKPLKTFIAIAEDALLGTYYIKTNHPGPGSHVCNCGYMVAPQSRGRGVARAMCEHSQEVAVELGFKAMQFNLVASTNEAAVHLWRKLGFQTVGTLPKAFLHPEAGYVDAYVMYKQLQS